ncbi:hypothetical protein MCHIJ_49900 [Mycolicibacterium chitae]|uniref:Uncharacterized protein n=1 Tax=Mycolicibacterium chitae TaxID=1792 RepID=A0A448I9Q7_MYCCI|nr:hypothetical protein [Mycolicibacterium chitae]MCV7107830.1 hypothetical protein [Mycolicibacterium chitae]BBZ05553.1 hypothetical protein MCHIJ_49900 [Mycolicibacterium chitae]VEG49167.1 Uncharacterised protein [Mycolicibacterium chitae]
MRVYLPATLGMLRQLVSDGELFPVGGTAFAVTPTLREAYAEGDDDELAEVALGEAARASLRLLAAEAPEDGEDVQGPEAQASDSQGSLPLRRAVIVADIEPATARPDLDDAVVRVGAPCRLDAVAAVYVDIADAEAAVRAAMAVIDEADLGDEDAELTVGDALDHDLAWYATQELPFLLELL